MINSVFFLSDLKVCLPELSFKFIIFGCGVMYVFHDDNNKVAIFF